MGSFMFHASLRYDAQLLDVSGGIFPFGAFLVRYTENSQMSGEE